MANVFDTYYAKYVQYKVMESELPNHYHSKQGTGIA